MRQRTQVQEVLPPRALTHSPHGAAAPPRIKPKKPKLEYSREPHVKVDDYKKPVECGRIYFAQDNEGRRFIVNHIGPHP